jgi:methyl-accepting chemotaxis protein
MPEERRRLFRLLRKTAQNTANAVSGRTAAEDAALWSSHDKAVNSARETSDAVQRIASTLAKQRGAVESTIDKSRAISARANDVTAALARLSALFERLGLVALNAGLEGARLPEQGGAALRLVSDDVRAHAVSGQETSRDLAAALSELASDLGHLLANLERAREASTDVAQEAARASGAAADAERALGDVGDRLKKATGSDPETVRAIADATEHARALVNSLGMLSGKVPQTLVLSALRPVLEPLGRMLETEEEGDGSGEGDREGKP